MNEARISHTNPHRGGLIRHWCFGLLSSLVIRHSGCAAIVVLGCGPSGPPNPVTHAGRQALAELPGLRSSPHQGLAAELALVEQAGGLPLQITPPQAGESSAAVRPPAIEQLQRAFPPLSRQLVLTPLAEIYPGGPLSLSPVQLERGRELLHKHAAARQQFQDALPKDAGGFGPRLASGTLADVSFLEPLTLGCRLEAVAAAVLLADNAPEDALAPLATILTVARLLAAEPNVTTRVAAANLRGDALHVLAAIAAHDHATRATHEQLFTLLAASTADWPADAHAWMGDRAAGLVIYELVREGHYLSLLSAEEVADLHRRQVLRATARAAVRNIDQDELFYLQSMRQLIDAANLPLCERQTTLDLIGQRLAARQQSSDYPLVAGTLLLTDYQTGNRRQGEDFAFCQAWLLALGLALGRDMPAPQNPLTGRPYTIDRTPLAVTIAGVLPDSDQTCRVPVLKLR